MTRIVDRESEAEALRRLADDGEKKLALLYGRRRVGKTYLLTNLWPRERAFYFTASATTEEQNRRQLIRQAAQWSGEEMREEDFPTWRTVFSRLIEMRSGHPLVIVLDEFQYLGNEAEHLVGVTSELNAAWEARGAGGNRLLLFVISGSSVRTLEALASGGAPLYGRFAWVGKLEPFDYLDAWRMAPFSDRRDAAYAYGIFGGMPRYLAPVDPSRSLRENVVELVLDPRGEVRQQMETALLQESGLRDFSTYQGILRAIAGGRTELNQIAQRAGLVNDTPLRRKVDRLMELRYVRRTRNLGAKRTTPYRYHLSDPAIRFYYAFVLPYESALAVSDPYEVWDEHLRSKLDPYMGPVFEDIAEQAYPRLRESRGLPMVREWGRWEGKDRAGDPLEMDIACELMSGGALTGLVKWNESPLAPRWHIHHLQMIDRLAVSGLKWAHAAAGEDAPLLYVAAGGFSDGFDSTAQASRSVVELVSLRHLYPSGGQEP
jgi:AAA+ ATPase superfamily predicted ATPase